MSLSLIITCIQIGLCFGIMAMGIHISFRILGVPDLTIDGAFTLGAAVSAFLCLNNLPILGLPSISKMRLFFAITFLLSSKKNDPTLRGSNQQIRMATERVMRGKNPPNAVGFFTFLIHLPIAILCLKDYHIRARFQNKFSIFF